MNVANYRRLVSLLIYCGVSVLVIVNGQSTTDDDFYKDEIARLIDIVAELRAELNHVKGELDQMSAIKSYKIYIQSTCDFTFNFLKFIAINSINYMFNIFFSFGA